MTTVLNTKIKQRNYKYKGEVLVTGAMFYVIVVILLISAAAMSWGTIRDFFKSGAQRVELNNMATAAAVYASLRTDGATPTSANDLITGVTATDAVDGMAHTGLMNGESGRWISGTYTDIWGNAFVFTNADGKRSITSYGPDGKSGGDDDIVVYY